MTVILVDYQHRDLMPFTPSQTCKAVAFVALLFVTSVSPVQGQAISKYIVTDQFGYLPASQKIAVIRDPQTGFDAGESFAPGASYALVDKTTNTPVFTANATAWNGGAEDASSGDKVWWFDFSSVTAPGTYYVLDVSNDVRSYEFVINDNVYKEALKHAVRAFYYQRCGFEKKAEHAGAAWADGASHMKPLQDKNARQYNKASDASTEVDVSGGWYDAGDYNKYTNWTANYVIDFMHAYQDVPGAWSDDYSLPESGNKIPDLLDEAKWGVDHLVRLQKSNGSVLSIVGESHASPPSSATGPSVYGTPSTSATLNTAAALALASKVYGGRGMKEYANKLKEKAVKAWDWATANPKVVFKNNDEASGTSDLGAGQQETDDYGRLVFRVRAACYLFEITGETKYRDYVDAHYAEIHLVAWSFAYPFETASQEVLLYYTKLPGATASVVNKIKDTYKAAMNGDENFTAFYGAKDPYGAHIKDYTWGSNSTKASMGLMYADMITYGIDASKNDDARKAAEGFIHYLHGTNPLSMLYLSNMNAYGGDNSVNEFYHSWFANGSAKWDRVGTSTYGPAPGFLTGGPNPSYDRDNCCATNSCGDANAVCNSESLVPPKGQPSQKSYKDFNTSWPLNSWSVTENSGGYQINYIRLLSRFVPANNDCSGTPNGAASPDACQQCAGGTTGIEPSTDESQCNAVTALEDDERLASVEVAPNPTTGVFTLYTMRAGKYDLRIVNALGNEVLKETHMGNATVDMQQQPPGVYVVRIGTWAVKKLVKI
ncbi:glycoside hydrolase family 9 protein [Chryseolinea lacunae]|uniref:Glycoside hydrolase family 9 protein n=1 Tax=Chryseolinea lacunae TaxID=2801331 RepID=A0ABS1KUJ2_9BACT|nr:glycoside hydrolase family 9 protein [Chryseolinea lacunae]MBL0743148.1 glycoside hydrolase family 9 protein [Chryseolinea lacunae]